MTLSPASLRQRRADAIAVAILLLPLVLAVPALLAGWAWSPAANLYTGYPWQGGVTDAGPPNPALSDVTQWFHPALVWSGAEIRAGRFPLWVPHAYAGAPFFANRADRAALPADLARLAAPAGARAHADHRAQARRRGPGDVLVPARRAARSPSRPRSSARSASSSRRRSSGWVRLGVRQRHACSLPLLFGAVSAARSAGPALGRAAGAVVALYLLAGYPQATFHALLAAGAWALARAPGAGLRSSRARAAGRGARRRRWRRCSSCPSSSTLARAPCSRTAAQWMPPSGAAGRRPSRSCCPTRYGSGAESWGRWQFNILSTLRRGSCRCCWRRSAPCRAGARPGARFFPGSRWSSPAMHYGRPAGARAAALPGLGARHESPADAGHSLFALCALGALGVDALRAASGDARAWPLRAWFVVLALAGFAWVAVHLGGAGRARSRVVRCRCSSPRADRAHARRRCSRSAGAPRAAPPGAPRSSRCRWSARLRPRSPTCRACEGRHLYPETPALRWLQRAAARARARCRATSACSTGSSRRTATTA